jgi:hypothetical protein
MASGSYVLPGLDAPTVTWRHYPESNTFAAYTDGVELGHVFVLEDGKNCFARLRDGEMARPQSARRKLNLLQAQIILVAAWREQLKARARRGAIA